MNKNINNKNMKIKKKNNNNDNNNNNWTTTAEQQLLNNTNTSTNRSEQQQQMTCSNCSFSVFVRGWGLLPPQPPFEFLMLIFSLFLVVFVVFEADVVALFDVAVVHPGFGNTSKHKSKNHMNTNTT